MCFGTCPVFSIDVDVAGKATYTAGKYSTEEGIFRSRINPNDLNQIRDLINYIGIKDLKDYYRVNWSDYPTCWITVKFDDGSSKKIEDYGELGTFGLRKLYKLFFELRNNQDWVQE